MDRFNISSGIPSFSISIQEFYVFHSIDRKLYYNLVINLRRDPTRSLHIMALFLWLERVTHNSSLVHTIANFPITHINTIADEAVFILTCIEHEGSYIPNHLVNRSISRIQSLVGYQFSLTYFHERRPSIIEGLSRIINNICLIVLRDIMQTAINQNGHQIPRLIAGPLPPLNDMYYYNTNTNPPMIVKKGGFLDLLLGDYSSEELNLEMEEVINHLPKEEPVDDNHGSQSQVPPDERTVFLTFSRGYPITETEVREYFLRKYGDIVETIFMQEVPHHIEQSLYARLILRSVSTMDVILNHKGKAKFSINGKHVWARKYVRKYPNSPPRDPVLPSSIL